MTHPILRPNASGINLPGLLLVYTFVFLSGANGVFLSRFLQSINPIVVLIINFVIVTAIFTLINLNNLNRIAEIIGKYKANVLYINLYSAGNWFFFFYALKYLEPLVAITLANGVGPLLTHFAQVGRSHLSRRDRLLEILSIFGVLTAMTILSVGTIVGRSALGKIDLTQALLGIFFAIACGYCIVQVTMTSKRLNAKGISAQQIMSLRFYLLIALAFLLLPDLSLLMTISVPTLATISSIALVGLCVPLLALQMGISRLSPMAVAWVLASAPAIIMALQMFDARLQFSIWSFVGTVLMMAISVLEMFRKKEL